MSDTYTHSLFDDFQIGYYSYRRLKVLKYLVLAFLALLIAAFMFYYLSAMFSKIDSILKSIIVLLNMLLK